MVGRVPVPYDEGPAHLDGLADASCSKLLRLGQVEEFGKSLHAVRRPKGLHHWRRGLLQQSERGHSRRGEGPHHEGGNSSEEGPARHFRGHYRGLQQGEVLQEAGGLEPEGASP